LVPESLRFKARDGVELQGLLYQPDPGVYPGKRPLLVRVHGGPTAQGRPGFRQSAQYLVNKGIAVFAVNVRGSTGFGKTYARLDNQEKRLDSVRDLVDTVEFLANDITLDTSRAAVMGAPMAVTWSTQYWVLTPVYLAPVLQALRCLRLICCCSRSLQFSGS
jgi:dipeptidyl aminopeptidase/acylaminoacyl peptidase